MSEGRLILQALLAIGMLFYSMGPLPLSTKVPQVNSFSTNIYKMYIANLDYPWRKNIMFWSQ